MTKKTKIWLAVGGGILFVGAMNAKAPPKRNRAHAAQEKAPETTAPPPAPAKAAQTAPDAGEAPPPQVPIAKAVTAPEPPPAPAPALPVSYWDNPELVQCGVRDNDSANLWAIVPGFFPHSANQFERRRLSKQRRELAKNVRKSTFIGRLTDSSLKIKAYNFRRETLPVSITGNFTCGRSPNAVAVKIPARTIHIPMSPTQAEQLSNARRGWGIFSRSGDLTANIAFRPIGGRIVRQIEPEVRGRPIAFRVREREVVLFDSKQ
jgi:hypothetical protein